MDCTPASSRLMSVNVPVAPPPSPFWRTPDRKDSMVAAFEDIEELLRHLRSETNMTVSESDEYDGRAVADHAAAFTLASLPRPSPAPAADIAAVTRASASPTIAVNAPCQEPEEASTAVEDGFTEGTDSIKISVNIDCINNDKPSETNMLTLPADAGDESLQRYKESLGLGGGKDLSDPNDPRVCIIQSLTLETPGRDPVTIDLSVPGSEATLKDHPFTIKEGSRFTMVATFKVQHEVLSGLRYVQVVKRKGVRVSKDSEMLGSYAPCTDKQPLYTKRCKFFFFSVLPSLSFSLPCQWQG